jgi:hypothetical protein
LYLTAATLREPISVRVQRSLTGILIVAANFLSILRPLACFPCLAALIVCSANAVSAQRPAPERAPVASDSLLSLLDRFLADPTRNGRRWREILDSAEANPNVVVTITAGVAPWICGASEKSSMERALRSILTGAFVAGNMREQLRGRTTGDQPLAGVLATLDSYQKIRARVLNFRLAELDRWAELQAGDSLAAHVDMLAAHPPTDCPRSPPAH